MSVKEWFIRTARRILAELFRRNKQQLLVVVDSYIERTADYASNELKLIMRDKAMQRLIDEGVKLTKAQAVDKANVLIETTIQEVLREK